MMKMKNNIIERIIYVIKNNDSHGGITTTTKFLFIELYEGWYSDFIIIHLFFINLVWEYYNREKWRYTVEYNHRKTNSEK